MFYWIYLRLVQFFNDDNETTKFQRSSLHTQSETLKDTIISNAFDSFYNKELPLNTKSKRKWRIAFLHGTVVKNGTL